MQSLEVSGAVRHL